MSTWLLDTGPLVAYLDRGDPHHDQVAAHLEPFAGQLATTSAVISEAALLVSTSFAGPTLLAELISSARVEVHDLCQPARLREAAALMQKYAETPMDFADATLVLLAEDLGVLDILTLDRLGFTAYQTRLRKPFRQVLPDP